MALPRESSQDLVVAKGSCPNHSRLATLRWASSRSRAPLMMALQWGHPRPGQAWFLMGSSMERLSSWASATADGHEDCSRDTITRWNHCNMPTLLSSRGKHEEIDALGALIGPHLHASHSEKEALANGNAEMCDPLQFRQCSCETSLDGI
eukprot:TRINITY_DN62887_c0_g1_i1.p1 TRINITY_DN62887_c0_g1~~TRINITY_DN62887_c0_g1_i1.p1  ORF type:complete len:150 (-),score=23.53 TRINITY_DN62887_c0_g1_i1:24-473(-)